MSRRPGDRGPAFPSGGTLRSDRGGRVIALDVGGKRIGVAISDETGTIATPLGNVARGRNDVDELRRLIADWGIERLVVGLPTGLSGREGPQAAEVRAYVASLSDALAAGAPAAPAITFWDERLTTAIAERALIASGARRGQRKARIDAVAAAVILQDYLDATRHGRR